jgi:hypothetical protein
MKIPQEFDTIRPWEPEDLPEVFDRRATDESVLPSDTTYHLRGKSMQTRLADRNGMHCRKTRTEINADKCRNLQPKTLHSSPYALKRP